MLKFIRGKAQQPSADRQKLQRELFAFRKTVHHGFPNKPTALAWDPELKLLALSTTNGTLKVIGKPGVEFYGQHHSDGTVTRILFVPNQGRLITLCDNNSLHLWEINDGCLEEVKSQVFEGKLKKISAMCIDSTRELLLLGTEGGNVYFLNLKTFQMLDSIIYVDIVMQNLPSTYKITNPGAVEAIAEQPGNPNHILIGYTRGLIVLWDNSNPTDKKIFINPQQLECLCWFGSGSKFASSHNDGSYAFWDVESEDKPIEEPTTLYGPFPCKPITKLLCVENERDNLIIFSGGMPRASYSEKYTVTVYGSNGKTHVVLDFTSKVIDFIYLESDKNEEPGILLVLAEEELIAVDLSSDDMKMVLLPYLASLHASAVTCSYHVSNVPKHLYDLLKEAGARQMQDLYSEKKWPELGGRLLNEPEETDTYELLLTGHEDGTVRFWDCGSVAFSPLYKFSSTPLFASDVPVSPSEDEDEWPPFKKIGTFDPYSDDPRLAVKKVWLCPKTGTLVVAGTAGHVIVATFGEDTPVDPQIPVRTINIVSDRDNFVWKGHEALSPTKQSTTDASGLQVSSILQLHPPASITALCCSTELGLIAAGTAHGLALYDYVRMQPVVTKCTLNPNDLSGAGEGPISRRKSLKKSLRESFRRLRRGRTTKGGGDKRGHTSPNKGQSIGSPIETRPVERQIEARPVDDSMGGTVRCVHIANTFLISMQMSSPTFWAGTNNGTVYAFTISMPPHQKRKDEDVRSQLGKEIQLKHRAPVLSVTVIDSNSLPLNRDSVMPHRVLICSEEQFKVFTLPGLKPLGKLKLTAHEGSRVRKTGFAKFMTGDKRTSETCLVCLTNLGDCLVLNVPEFRRQLNAAVVPPEDMHGIYSLTFTSEGEAFYLHSSSEYQRISLSATKVTALGCRLDLPESAREKPEVEESSEDEASEREEAEEEEEQGQKEDEEGEGEKNESKTSDDDGIREVVEKKCVIEEKQTVLNDEPPIVNGSYGWRIKLPPLENGVEEDKLDFSIGDITVDSVKEHITNLSHSVGGGSQEEVKSTVVVKTSTSITETSITSAAKN